MPSVDHYDEKEKKRLSTKPKASSPNVNSLSTMFPFSRSKSSDDIQQRLVHATTSITLALPIIGQTFSAAFRFCRGAGFLHPRSSGKKRISTPSKLKNELGESSKTKRIYYRIDTVIAYYMVVCLNIGKSISDQSHQSYPDHAPMEIFTIELNIWSPRHST